LGGRKGTFFRDYPGEPVPLENFWTLWCKGGLTEADTPTIRLAATPSGLTSAHLHNPPSVLQAKCPSCHPTNSVKALNNIVRPDNYAKKMLWTTENAESSLKMLYNRHNVRV